MICGRLMSGVVTSSCTNSQQSGLAPVRVVVLPVYPSKSSKYGSVIAAHGAAGTVTVRFWMMAGGWMPELLSFFQANTNWAVELEVGLAFGFGIFATTWMVLSSRFKM